MIEGRMEVADVNASSEYERAVALQAMIAAIMFVGEGIIAEMHQTGEGPRLESCVKRAKQLVELAENSVGSI